MNRYYVGEISQADIRPVDEVEYLAACAEALAWERAIAVVLRACGAQNVREALSIPVTQPTRYRTANIIRYLASLARQMSVEHADNVRAIQKA